MGVTSTVSEYSVGKQVYHVPAHVLVARQSKPHENRQTELQIVISVGRQHARVE